LGQKKLWRKKIDFWREKITSFAENIHLEFTKKIKYWSKNTIEGTKNIYLIEKFPFVMEKVSEIYIIYICGIKNRPRAIQSQPQVVLVHELAAQMRKHGMALPNCSAWSVAYGGGVSLRQLMNNQQRFLPNDQARRFAHIPKVSKSRK
jgi:hypothetical protein